MLSKSIAFYDFRPHRWFRLLRHNVRLPFRDLFGSLSLCYCIVVKRQKISTQFLSYTTTNPQDRVKIWFTLVTLSYPNSTPMWSTPCWFEHRRHLTANCCRAEWLEIAQWSQWTAYETAIAIALSNDTIATATTSPSPKMMAANASSRTIFAARAATWRIWQNSHVAIC